jgi:hypothetical protein
MCSPIGVHRGGGGQQFYIGVTRDNENPAPPMLVRGRDMRAFSDAFERQFRPMVAAYKPGQPMTRLDMTTMLNDAMLMLNNQQTDEKLR